MGIGRMDRSRIIRSGVDMTDNSEDKIGADTATAKESEELILEKVSSYDTEDIDAITLEDISGALQYYLNLGIFTRVGVPSDPDKLFWAVTLADGADFTFAQKCDVIAFIDGMLAMTHAQDALTQKLFGSLLGKQK